MMQRFNDVGLVTIGRNEGERLRTCLLAAQGQVAASVYVDSGSTDGSIGLAQSLGAVVVELDKGRPFTAARARNAGAERLLALAPQVQFIQFVDGDCELFPEWINNARQFLRDHPQAAVACGRRRERYPNATVLNRLVDMEWNTPVGRAREFGGDALMRVSTFQQAGGYRPTMIAGEEPELAVRLRQSGWEIHRLDVDMTWHDIAMTRLGQWFRRNQRAGHALAERAFLHGRPPERDCVRERRSTLLWGAAIPLVTLVLAVFVSVWGLGLLGLYLLLAWRVQRWRRRCGDSTLHAVQYAVFCVAAKLPQLVGLLTFYLNRLLGRASRLIEYRQTETPTAEMRAQNAAQPLSSSGFGGIEPLKS